MICDISGIPRPITVFDRHDLAPGDQIEGPALITEPQTTTLVSADFTCMVDAAANLVLTRLPLEGLQ